MKGIYYPIAQHLQTFCEEGQFVIWRDAFRWKDINDNVLSNHYDGMSLEQLADDFGYEIGWAYNLHHVGIVRRLK